jgi:hypothetical protein
MTHKKDPCWTELRPPLLSKGLRDFAEFARAIVRVRKDEGSEEAIEELRRAFVGATKSYLRIERQTLLAAGLVLSDLAIQSWQVRVRQGCVEVHPPAQVSGNRTAEKARIRRQELVKRDAQLRNASVQKFLRSMERTRVSSGGFVSIFSLLRDGRELAEHLRTAREHPTVNWEATLASVVDPYIEFVSSEDAACPFTGLRLMDIWRYFRHTWSNQYSSVPGRSMIFLVRDRAHRLHPVIGIGALSSPVMQIRERDTWVGWHPDTFLSSIKANASREVATWLVDVVSAAIEELYLDDFLEDGLLAARDLVDPDCAVIDRLYKESAEQRRLHHRFVRSRDHKTARTEITETEYWIRRARTHLFRSKRALALASYLTARAVLKKHFGRRPTAVKLAKLASTGQGKDVIRKILKKAKADRVGIAIADITVCGAVQPYNAILGGKLVAMLAASAEVILEYRRRYSSAESEIASSMAGRPVIREPTLVLLGTTSLYGVGSSQYNRIKIPCDQIGGSLGEAIHYEELGRSEAFGTSQYSDEAVDALADLVQQSANGTTPSYAF